MNDKDKREALQELGKIGLEFAQAIHKLVPDGRYKSLALTALEEADLWTHKGISVATEASTKLNG